MYSLGITITSEVEMWPGLAFLHLRLYLLLPSSAHNRPGDYQKHPNLISRVPSSGAVFPHFLQSERAFVYLDWTAVSAAPPRF